MAKRKPKVRERIVDIRPVRAGDLIPNPRNWRQHPAVQRNAMAAILAEVGNIDVLKAVETDDGLMLIDGHLRAELMPDDKVQVAVLDLTEAERVKVLATFDPLAAMAQTDLDGYLSLAAEVETDNEAIKALLEAVANAEQGPMPDFEPVGEDEQGRLDEKAKVACPECGYEFTP